MKKNKQLFLVIVDDMNTGRMTMGDLISLSMVQIEGDTAKACERNFKRLGKGTAFSDKIPLSQDSSSSQDQKASFGYLHFDPIRTLPTATSSFVLQLSQCQSVICSERKTTTSQIFSQLPYGHRLPIHYLPREKGTEVTALAIGDANGDGKTDIMVKLASGAALIFLQPTGDELLSPSSIFCS